MRTSTKVLSITLAGMLAAAGISFAQLASKAPEAKAPTPPACVCSRATAIVGGDDAGTVAGQVYPRYGITHCQCGPLTCVSQIPFASVGTHQLACVK